jgi:hypothetical protein
MATRRRKMRSPYTGVGDRFKNAKTAQTRQKSSRPNNSPTGLELLSFTCKIFSTHV